MKDERQCLCLDPDEDPDLKSDFEYHCYYNHLNGTNQMNVTFEVSYNKQWGKKNLARLNQTGKKPQEKLFMQIIF